MYHLFRRLHLFCGLLLLVFVLMYFVSGYIIIHRPWFGKTVPETNVRTERFDPPAGLSDEDLSAWLQRTFDLRGQRVPASHRPDGSVRFNFVRPGTSFEAVLKPGSNEVTITRKQFAAVDIFNGLHRLHGYHGGLFYWLWAFVYDLASAVLILFALSGVLLWYQSTSKRMAGFICLGVSCGFTMSMILYLMLHR